MGSKNFPAPVNALQGRPDLYSVLFQVGVCQYSPSLLNLQDNRVCNRALIGTFNEGYLTLNLKK
jgi:hypothetical protein